MKRKKTVIFHREVEKRKRPKKAWGALSPSKMMSPIARIKASLVRRDFSRLPLFGRSFCRQNSDF